MKFKLMDLIKFGMITITALLLAYPILPVADANPTSTPWLSGWSNRINMTIDQTKIDDDLSNFTVLVHLNSSSGINGYDLSYIFNTLGSDANRKKIAFTTSDGITQLYAEIEKWDTPNKQAWIWVKVPRISSTVNTELYLYYDVNHTGNTAYIGDTGSTAAQNVWNSNFKTVLHLAENSTGAAGEFKDSTNRHHDGTGYGRPTRETGMVGNNQFFDGNDDYISIPDSNDFSWNPTKAITIEWWFIPTTLTWRTATKGNDHYINMMGKGDYPDGWEYVFTLGQYTGLQNYKDQEIAFYTGVPTGGIQAGSGDFLNGKYNQSDYGPRYNVGDKIYVIGRMDARYIYVDSYYKDGIRLTDQTDFTNYGGKDLSPSNTWSEFHIGTIPTQGQMFEGIIDEVRISNVFLPDAWLKASYYSESDKLLTYSARSTQSSTLTTTPSPTPSPTPMSTTNLIGYWKFDENTGTTASDSSGNDNKGIISGGATRVAGKVGNALSFDGVNDYVDTGNPVSLQITGAISLEGWIKINDLSVSSSLYGRGHGLGSNGNYGYFLTYYAPTKALYFDTYNTTKRDALSKTNAIIDNNWHHIVATWDGTTSANGKKLYIDGVPIAQKTSAIASIGIPSYNFRIGIDSLNNYPAKATIDEVKIYNRALSASEVVADYNAG